MTMRYKSVSHDRAPTRLDEREVHLWCVRLDARAEALPRLQSILSEAELDRAARFTFAKHQRRFVAAREILRLLLARYLNTPSETIRFGHGTYGKPFVSEPGKGLHVNVSHSENLGLFGFCALEERVSTSGT
jgi:4'-phosphopantetheinyl transferase